MLGNGNSHSNNNKGKKLPSLEEFKDLFSVSIYNYIKLIAEDINEINGLVKRTDIITIP